MNITVAALQVMDSCGEIFRGIEWEYDCDPLSTEHYAKQETMRALHSMTHRQCSLSSVCIFWCV